MANRARRAGLEPFFRWVCARCRGPASGYVTSLSGAVFHAATVRFRLGRAYGAAGGHVGQGRIDVVDERATLRRLPLAVGRVVDRARVDERSDLVDDEQMGR